MIKEAIAGTFAGVVGTVLGFPLDTIKTRMQVVHSPSFVTTAKDILNDGGIASFYRGVASPLVALTILNTLNFSSYAFFKKEIGIMREIEAGEFEVRIGLAAACVGPLSSMISTPFELIKTQMQLNKKNSVCSAVYKNSFECSISVLGQHGIRGLYVGHGVNTLREIVFLSIYFTVYEHIKSITGAVMHQSIAIPFAGGISGAAGWFISFPLDLIKANIQGRIIDLTSNQSGAFSTGLQIVRLKGITSLYSGIVPSVARAFIVSSSRFTAYETAMSVLACD